MDWKRRCQFLLLLVFHTHMAKCVISVLSEQTSSEHRVKRSWTYPPINIAEGYGVFPSDIATIKSDNPNAKKYKLEGAGVGESPIDKNAKFIIIEDTGVIKQLKEVDREEKDKYEVIASALDTNDNPVEQSVSLFITVLDMNDNRPVFIPSALSGSVPEGNDASSTPFLAVNVTDADIGMNGRAGVKFSIQPGSDKPPSIQPRFSVDKNTGRVSVVGKLDYETDPKVYFTVVAEDGGRNPGLVSSATVTVTVLDSNDHAPVLEKTPPKAVSELFPVDVHLYEITASDVDEGINKEVYFDIVSGNTGGTFDIESRPSDAGKSFGMIKLAKQLDFEDGETEFSLQVKAFNKKAENADSYAMSSFTTVVIKVTDGNEPPEFQNTPYNALASEATLSPFVLNVPVSARDRDFGSNQTITFSITDDPENWFEIDPAVGKVTAKKQLDREAPSVVDSIYTLKIKATDNYPGNPASVNGQVMISIEDINDNPPTPVLPEERLKVTVCEKPVNDSVILIEAFDPDEKSKNNGPPFTFKFDASVPKSQWGFHRNSPTSAWIKTYAKNLDVTSDEDAMKLQFIISDSGSPTKTSTATLTVKVCRCDEDGEPNCSSAIAVGAFPIWIVIAIIVVLLVIVVILAAVSYKRRRDTEILKVPLTDDEDDVRENLQVYHEEGGEEDFQAYDLSALQAPPLLDDPRILKRDEMQPCGQSNIGSEFPDMDALKEQADNDPSAPPFDSLLVFDYEGIGSDAGSLSSINTATTDGSMDYDYLNDWGPRFKKLADMYTGGYDSE